MGYINELSKNNKKLIIDYISNYSLNEDGKKEVTDLISVFSIVLRNTTDFKYNYSYLTDFTQEFFEYIDIVKKKIKLAEILLKSKEIKLLNTEEIEISIDDIIIVDNQNEKKKSYGNGDLRNLFNKSTLVKMSFQKESTDNMNFFVKNYYIGNKTDLNDLGKAIIKDLKNRSEYILEAK